jgi:hypothetical protein
MAIRRGTLGIIEKLDDGRKTSDNQYESMNGQNHLEALVR